jgi:hypothetical protein
VRRKGTFLSYQTRHRTIIGFLVLSLAACVLAWQRGLEWKLFCAYVSTAITLTGYAFYISQMYPPPGKTAVRPEPLTWVLFGFLTATGWIIQVAQGADAGSWCLGVTWIACFLIAGWSYFKFEWTFDASHIWVAVAALFLFTLSVLFRANPALATASAVAATLADLVSYKPTFQKAWSRPYEDSITNFTFNSVKCIPALLALSSFTVATTVYLLMLTVVNGGFAIFLALRRAYLDRHEPQT